MGLSSSSQKTTTQNTSTSSPLDQYSPYINQALANGQQVFSANQGTLQGLSGALAQGFANIAPQSLGASPYVQNAQNNASAIGSGLFYGSNPGAQTYQSLQQAQNPSLSTLSGLTQSATANPYQATLGSLAGSATANSSIGTLNGLSSSALNNSAIGTLNGLSASALNNPALGGLSSLGASYSNPASGTLASIASGNASNPASLAYASLLNGGRNNATAGLTAYGYGTGSLGAGDGTLGQFASSGNNGAANGADGYDQSVIAGKYLNAEPGSALYSKLINGDPAVNPYVDAITNQATAAARLAQNQRFGASGLGSGLSSAYDAALGSAVADANNQTRYTAYNDAANRQLTAAGQADSAFAAERNNMEGASGRISANYNAGQDRSLSAATGLSAGSRADAATRLGALGQLSSANQAQTQNRLAAAAGLGSTINSDVANQLSAAGTLGSQYNTGYGQQADIQSQLGSLYNAGQSNAASAAQAAGSLYNAGQSNAQNAAQAAGNLYNTGQANAQNAAQAAGSLYGQGQSNALGAASALGSQYNSTAGLNLNAAQAADTSQQNQIQQILSALGLTGGLENASYAGIDPTIALAQAAATIPYAGTNSYANLINSLTGKYGTTTGSGTNTTVSNPSLLSSIGQAAQIGALAFSDRRLKTAIRKTGQYADGLGRYAWRYIWGGDEQEGVMADEVAKLRPWALGPTVAGFATVDYGSL